MPNVVRPRSIASMPAYTAVMNSPDSSSPYGACQPPRSKPKRRSSSGPPPPWYTPSRDTNTIAVNFMTPRLSGRGVDRQCRVLAACRLGCTPPPRCRTRPPASHLAPVRVVLRAVGAGKRRLLIEVDEARDGQPDDRGVHEQADAAEDRRLAHDD